MTKSKQGRKFASFNLQFRSESITGENQDRKSRWELGVQNGSRGHGRMLFTVLLSLISYPVQEHLHRGGPTPRKLNLCTVTNQGKP